MINGDSETKTEVERLRALTESLRASLEEANETIQTQESQLANCGKLEAAARQVVKSAVWSKGDYSLGHKSIENLWAALEPYLRRSSAD